MSPEIDFGMLIADFFGKYDKNLTSDINWNIKNIIKKPIR
jgi:hypothetical protein